MTDKKTVVKVTIGGDEYTLKSDRPPEYTKAVAEHVDKALQEVLSVGSIVETHKAAILAALAITDELFQEKKATREVTTRVNRIATDLCRVLPPSKRGSQASGSFATFQEES